MSVGTNNFNRKQIKAPEIVPGNLDSGDTNQPYNFLEWQARSTSIKPDQVFAAYNTYVRNWYNRRAIANSIPVAKTIREDYVNLLKQLTLTNISKADAKFLQNLDYNSDIDMAIAVPYFARQLKQIALYLSSKRESAKAAKLKYSMAGTSQAIEKVLYQHLLTAFTKKNNATLIFDEEFYNTLPALSAVNGYLGIKVEELYDEANYADSDIRVPVSAYSPNDDLSFAAPGLTSDVVKALAQIRNYSLSATDVQTKYLGVAHLSVSANNDGEVSVIQTITPDTPYMHLDNRYYPTVAAIPNISTTKTQAEIGGYFTYKNLGVSTYLAATKNFDFEITSMVPGVVYDIPDPLYINHGRSLTENTQTSIVRHTKNLDWVKSTQTNVYNDGKIKHAYDVQKFVPYQSRFETAGVDTQGTTRTSDRFDFWTGPFSDIWADQSNHPLSWRGDFDIQSRTELLQITDKRIFNWATDIFGNQYTLYKDFSVDGVQLSVYDKRLGIGEVWVRLLNGKVGRGPDILKNVFAKYQTINPAIYQKLVDNEIRSFDVVYNTFIIEIDGFVLIEEFQYDFDAQEIISGTNRTMLVIDDVENYGGFWFNEYENTLVFCIIRNASQEPDQLDYGVIDGEASITLDYGDLGFASMALDYGNVTQLNLIYPEMHKHDLGMSNLVQMFPPVGTVPTDLIIETSLFITGNERPVIAYNQDTKTYNIAFLTYDTLNGIYLFSTDLVENNKYSATVQDIFVHVLSIPENGEV